MNDMPCFEVAALQRYVRLPRLNPTAPRCCWSNSPQNRSHRALLPFCLPAAAGAPHNQCDRAVGGSAWAWAARARVAQARAARAWAPGRPQGTAGLGTTRLLGRRRHLSQGRDKSVLGAAPSEVPGEVWVHLASSRGRLEEGPGLVR